MTDDLIRRQDAIELIENESRTYGDEYGVSDVLCDLADLPSAQPPVDGVEVVRCKYCEHWKREVSEIGDDYFCEFDCNKSYREDFFCADGERRSE